MTGAPLEQLLLYRLAAEPFGGGTTGGFVSGARLAREFGVTRGAVWKAAVRLRELGVDLDSLPRQGYRLATPCSPLSSDALRAALPQSLASLLHELDVRWETGSTNADLLQRPPPPGRFGWRIAEHQTAGRGRRGRTWLAAPGTALCLSWSWRFDALPAHLPSLGLAIGVAVVRALDGFGLRGAGLKWPNDLVTRDGKLAGILIEMVSEAGGPALVVVGLGLNLALGRSLRQAIAAEGNRATDLVTLARDNGVALPDRNRLAAAIVAGCIDTLRRWDAEGFEPLRGEWAALDRLRGLEIVVQGARTRRLGIARGIDADGALLVDDGVHVHRCAAGEVSVRTAGQTD